MLDRSYWTGFRRWRAARLQEPGILSFWDENGTYQSFGDKASLYFTIRGDVAITTPTRSTVPVSVLKRAKATIEALEGEQTISLTRSFKVSNQ